ncbi:DUF6059 family protein [Streptomyces sp. NPDC048436]|uniref:DUF6059 family protein n=1 Tax=Streptomyces sp. NPDC048436 TaxID=3365550 RepID=UPI0037116D68
MFSLAARMLHFLWDGMIAFGESMMGPVPPTLKDPAPGHPERLCPDRPLSKTERIMARQLNRRR